MEFRINMETHNAYVHDMVPHLTEQGELFCVTSLSEMESYTEQKVN